VTEDEFWDHIRATRRVDPETHTERLAARLAKLPEGDILDFVRRWDEASARAYRRDLWGAAYLINGGCSDDGFQYFRWWLILQGRPVYEAALADPDTLAEVLDGEDEVECECYPGMDAWFAATGTARDEAGYDAYGRAMKFRHPKPPRPPKLAKEWDFDDDDEVRRRLPRLAAMYLDDPGEDD
jgi:hypothetical protein